MTVYLHFLLIGSNKSVFVKDDVNENILFAHELVQNFNQRHGPKAFCEKIDLRMMKCDESSFSYLHDMGSNNIRIS